MNLNRQVFLSLLFGLALLGGCSRNLRVEKQRYLESGERFFRKGEYAEAAIEFRNALQIDPRYIEAYLRLGRTYGELQQWPEAAASLSLAAEIDPPNLQIRFLLAEVYLNEHNYQDAEKEADFILQQEPDNAAAHQLRGAALIGSGQKERALESFGEVARLLPNDSSSLVNLAIVESGLQHINDAEKHLRKAQQIAPHTLAAYLNLASLYRRNYRMSDAEAVLWHGVQTNPDGSPLYLDLADTLYAEGKTELADRVIGSLRDKQPKSPETELSIGDLYYGRRNLNLAETAYKRGLQFSPDNKDLKQRLVEIDLERSDLIRARLLNDQIFQKDPANLGAHISLARILLADGKSTEALAELRKQLAIYPASPQVHFYLAHAYSLSEASNLAEDEFRKALDLDPNFFLAMRSLADMQLSQGEKGAIESANRCVSLRPSDPSQHLLLGTAYFQSGDLVRSREQFTIAQQLAPRDPQILYNLALCSLKEHRPDQAKRELEAALQLNPNFIDALGKLTDLDLASKKRSDAVARVRTFLHSYPDSPEAHVILGSLYMAEKEFDAAEPEFDRAIQLDPDLVSAYLNLGRLYQQTDKPDLAIHQYQSALALQPKFAPLITLVGNIYLEKGDLQTAQKYFEQALAAKPDFAVAASNLAWIYAQQGTNLKVALDLARAANRQLPEVDSVTDTLGWVHYESGEYSDAVSFLRECVHKVPGRAMYRYHLGMALVGDGQKDEGRQELKAALRLNLSGIEADHARESLAQLR